MRIKQLNSIISKYPEVEVIAGDCNFTFEDDEYKWIHKKG